METDCDHLELGGMSGFEEGAELNGFEGTDVKDMRLEAEAVVNDVLFAVNNMFVSKTLRCADEVAYINVETRERNRYCLELTEAGLRVVGYAFDHVDDHVQTPYHETVYSLLDTLSPAYREAFGNALLQRLEALQRNEQS
ncbi:GSK3B-interacting protein [Sorex fumeus]|uniref:GSK3B-interacting protein n=1 Tax=Sorex fumeus TaxID=62283 RepID=UPI0024AE3501|nr:GSK3B-interacting protein [Sorex fumeus]